ncbi:sulfur carrier protein ThiS [Bacillus sp. 2205SS5-2]|uniref:sulfur carrier protein ThiS n=1 Tax=Bacillus sp. 2205SS5-2 TaxID=3109031 RepID=UPI003006A2E0
MELRLNGSKVAVPDELKTVVDLIGHFELQASMIIIELNDKILAKEQYVEAEIRNGDTIELVQFVGGG